MIREIKRVISEDLSRRYTTVQEISLLHKCASLDPRFKGLPLFIINIVTSVPNAHQHCPGDGRGTPAPARHRSDRPQLRLICPRLDKPCEAGQKGNGSPLC